MKWYFSLNRILIGLIFFIVKTNLSIVAKDIKIAYWSTWNIACGVAMYTQHVTDALRHHGYQVKVYPHFLKREQLLKHVINDKVKILNIQYASSIMPEITELIAIVDYLRRQNVKVIVTIHENNSQLINLLSHVDMFISHKPLTGVKIAYIPMGVPVFKSNSNYRQLKRKFGFREDCKIITTTGFMLDSKEIDKILAAFVPILKKNPNYYIQLLTPFTERWPSMCEIEYNKIKHVITKNHIEKQIIHITEFLPQKELSERISISDVGYQWLKFNTPATSASAKEFISTRVPLVIPNSTHFHDLTKGIIRTSMDNIQELINTIVQLVENKEKNQLLRKELEKEYKKLNYNVIIKQHLKLFNNILKS